MTVFAALAAARDSRPFEAAIHEARAYGYNPDGGDSIIYHNPPMSGQHVGPPYAFKVIIQRPSSSDPRQYLEASAVATLDHEGTPCLLAVGEENGGLTDVGRELMKSKGFRTSEKSDTS